MRAYFADFDDYEGTGIAFIAKNAKEAKRMAWNHPEYGGEYIDLHVLWLKKANIDGLPEGQIVANSDALKRGIYTWVDDECPICKKVRMLYLWEEYDCVMCSECEGVRDSV